MANLVARRYLTIFAEFVGLYALKELYTKDCLPQTLLKIALITKQLNEILYIKSFTCVNVLKELHRLIVLRDLKILRPA